MKTKAIISEMNQIAVLLQASLDATPSQTASKILAAKSQLDKLIARVAMGRK